MKQLITIGIIFLFFIFEATSQNQANIWYFSYKNGLGFNSGYPEVLTDCPDDLLRSTCISDTNGNLLFFTSAYKIWNKNLEVMQNGSGLNGDGSYPKQPVVIVPHPGNQFKYYIFTVGGYGLPVGLQYSIVDMTLDNNNGAVIEKNSVVEKGVWARQKITAVRHSNNTDWWIITRLYHPIDQDQFASFLLTSEGINTIPVLSPAIEPHNPGLTGQLKVSHDRKKVISVESVYNSAVNGRFDVCSFNASTGDITHLFLIKEYPTEVSRFGITGMEISPDSKLLYISFHDHDIVPYVTYNYIYQYDLTKTDSLAFLNSRIAVDTLTRCNDLQLAPDGKIYASTYNEDPTVPHRYLDVITDVWKRGPDCNYLRDQVDLIVPQAWGANLPFFISEQLYRFIWKGGPCAKTTFTFRHRFIPEPDSIVWNFGDGTTSTVFNPTHIFQSGGNYEVHAHVVYPDGRIEETSREVEVLAVPEPWLGNDTLMCSNSTIDLNAGSGFTQYVWNGQFPPGNQYYTVTDTGYYSVKVKNDVNCYGSDTIHISFHPQVFFDDSQLVISPTTCGNNTGAIRGIQVGEQATIEWHDINGNLIDTSIDIDSLAVGNYLLTITDTTGCTTQIPAYTVNSTDFNLVFQPVQFKNPSCGQANGRVEIITSVFSDLLEYSLDAGNTWHANNGIFLNVLPDTYYAWVKDREGCVAAYPGNPVILQDTGGPVVTFKDSTNATGSNPDGSITVIATGDSLSYLLNGITLQDTGYFTGLVSGDYTILITDKYGCDTTVFITVEEISGLSLSAITQGERKCLYQIATSPVKVSNLNGVKYFRATILYNEQKITCTNLIEKALTDMTGTLYPGKIVLEWHGNEPLGITDTLVIGKLLFETKEAGTVDLRWEADTVATIFTDVNGNEIDAHLEVNSDIEVSNPPTIISSGDMAQCENSLIMISAFTFNGIEPYTYEWTKPNNQTESNSSFIIFSLKPSDEGEYTVKVTDAYDCIAEDTLKINVVPNPTAGFISDTLPFIDQYRLQATAGYAHYLWSNGDTTSYIDVTEEGTYTVILKTEEGCTDSSTVVMKKILVLDLQVPSAFTPNGDGLNDVFRPVMNTDLLKQFSMVIYNKWGQRIFETYDPIEGWQGKNAAAGVYSWMITYEDQIGNISQAKGSVVLIK